MCHFSPLLFILLNSISFYGSTTICLSIQAGNILFMLIFQVRKNEAWRKGNCDCPNHRQVSNRTNIQTQICPMPKLMPLSTMYTIFTN